MIINNKVVKDSLTWAGKCLHAPEQRLILGATALATQPFIDLNNKEVDEDTRKLSAARTVAKIIAGTIVGVGVRYLGIKAVRAFSQYSLEYTDSTKKFIKRIIPAAKKSFLTPTSFRGAKLPLATAEFDKRLEKYRKAMGTLAATVAMVATNFLLDAPLTKYLTGVFQRELTADTAKTQKTEVKK